MFTKGTKNLLAITAGLTLWLPVWPCSILHPQWKHRLLLWRGPGSDRVLQPAQREIWVKAMFPSDSVASHLVNSLPRTLAHLQRAHPTHLDPVSPPIPCTWECVGPSTLLTALCFPIPISWGPTTRTTSRLRWGGRNLMDSSAAWVVEQKVEMGRRKSLLGLLAFVFSSSSFQCSCDPSSSSTLPG